MGSRLRPRWHPRLWARRGFPQDRILFHRRVAPLWSKARRRAARRATADCDRRDRHRAGRRAGAGLRRRDRADRAVADHRRVHVRHRHAARQRLRLRHALHGGRRSGRMLIALALFIVGSVIGSLHLPAFLRARRHRSGPGVELFRAWGGLAVTLASIAVAAMMIVAIARRAARISGRPADRDRRNRDRGARDRRIPRRPASVERDLRLHAVGRKIAALGASISRARNSGNGRDRSARSPIRSSPTHRASPTSG